MVHFTWKSDEFSGVLQHQAEIITTKIDFIPRQIILKKNDKFHSLKSVMTFRQARRKGGFVHRLLGLHVSSLSYLILNY